MLELRKLSKVFGRNLAVDDFSAAFPAGEMVAIIGSSGAGKSTLLRMINRLHEPSSGTLLYRGEDILALRGKALRSWRQRCAMIFQQFNLVPRLDVITNVMLGRLNQQSAMASIFNYFSAADLAAALECLARLGVLDQAAQRASSLSGGQQQRVAIARALMQRPSIVLADEPIASLDPLNSELVMQALREINQCDGHTIICNLHSLDVARRYCDRIIGMRLGKMVFDGRASELTERIANDIYQGEQGSAPVPSELHETGTRISSARPDLAKAQADG